MSGVSQRKIIWFAIAFSSFIYAAILWSLSRSWPQPGPFAEAFKKPMITGLYVIAAIEFVFALVFPNMISDAHTRFITRLALFEAVAIFGLVASFLAQDWRLYVAPWILAMMGFVMNYPSDEAPVRPG